MNSSIRCVSEYYLITGTQLNTTKVQTLLVMTFRSEVKMLLVTKFVFRLCYRDSILLYGGCYMLCVCVALLALKDHRSKSGGTGTSYPAVHDQQTGCYSCL